MGDVVAGGIRLVHLNADALRGHDNFSEYRHADAYREIAETINQGLLSLIPICGGYPNIKIQPDAVLYNLEQNPRQSDLDQSEAYRNL
jgi:hypothetical protein